jgi:hypothetical protein
MYNYNRYYYTYIYIYNMCTHMCLLQTKRLNAKRLQHVIKIQCGRETTPPSLITYRDLL